MPVSGGVSQVRGDCVLVVFRRSVVRFAEHWMLSLTNKNFPHPSVYNMFGSVGSLAVILCYAKNVKERFLQRNQTRCVSK